MTKKRGITQEELSEQIGVHENTIRLWEKWIREPRSSDIAKLCEVLGCTKSEFLNGSATQTWELRLVMNKTGKEKKGDTADMSGGASIAVMNL